MNAHSFLSPRLLAGAAVVGLIGAAGVFIYEQVYAEKRRTMLAAEVQRLDRQVCSMRTELEALRALQKETHLRRLKQRKPHKRPPKQAVVPSGDTVDGAERSERSYTSDSEYFTDYQSVLSTDGEMDSDQFYDVPTDEDSDDTLRGNGNPARHLHDDDEGDATRVSRSNKTFNETDCNASSRVLRARKRSHAKDISTDTSTIQDSSKKCKLIIKEAKVTPKNKKPRLQTNKRKQKQHEELNDQDKSDDEPFGSDDSCKDPIWVPMSKKKKIKLSFCSDDEKDLVLSIEKKTDQEKPPKEKEISEKQDKDQETLPKETEILEQPEQQPKRIEVLEQQDQNQEKPPEAIEIPEKQHKDQETPPKETKTLEQPEQQPNRIEVLEQQDQNQEKPPEAIETSEKQDKDQKTPPKETEILEQPEQQPNTTEVLEQQDQNQEKPPEAIEISEKQDKDQETLPKEIEILEQPKQQPNRIEVFKKQNQNQEKPPEAKEISEKQDKDQKTPPKETEILEQPEKQPNRIELEQQDQNQEMLPKEIEMVEQPEQQPNRIEVLEQKDLYQEKSPEAIEISGTENEAQGRGQDEETLTEHGLNNPNNIGNFALDAQVEHHGQVSFNSKIKANRHARVHGKPYLGFKKVGQKVQLCTEKPARALKPRCSHTNMSYKTKNSILCALITDDDREKIHKEFWAINTWAEKKGFIRASATRRGIKRRRKTGLQSSTKKQSGHDFFLMNIKVCKKMYLSTLAIGEDSLRRWTKSNEDVSGNDSEAELGSSRAVRSLQKDSVLVKNIKTWLDMLPKVPSHYCRASSKKLYVESTFRSISHMHEVYKEWCIENNHKVASRPTFTKVLDDENIAIHHPRKDQCDTCCSFQKGNITKEIYDKHIEKKDEARNAKKDAVSRASENVMVITVDVQSVLLAPNLLASSIYYKQKLQCHNFTVYDTATKNVTIYFWHEADGNVTANDFTSCLIDYIKTVPENTKEVIIISDGCGHQNRNRILASALSDLSQKMSISIQQLYLEKGHTMMEVDSVHSTIEHYIKPPIYAPSDYIARMRQARQQNPYDIKSLHFDFFLDYEALQSNLKSIRPGKKKGDPVVVDIRSMKYLADGTILYKLRHPDEWKEHPQRRPSNLRRNVDGAVPKKLYCEQIKITESKFKHLQELKEVIDKDYHPFYDSLTYISGV